ncbi:MAG: hypothetical protein A2945_01015 [Candidatus Liptonbacteria bacterium RIFCSPLOWO2_01_FULL_52_25]|uniref:Uncharacterized protein n=1 Tax=Candidatus Liptonbacteria bacterium RIFCSPLOWO2_01_FULL_52_25 TaxID=1798650 RepID=A0A1G2CFJ2_9BACT|nr:MAG: hypothetical protein A2945_01015 [Candidatus Liptonbacteria bacterium RIFCSPLOWO2_01_FULL_52_25]
MKFNWDKMEKIGEGGEKEVYLHPEFPEKKVVSRLKEGGWNDASSERKIKARFYLTKVLHLLLPKNIPDVHLAIHGKDKVLVSERKKMDKEHRALAEDTILKFESPHKSKRVVSPEDLRARLGKNLSQDDEVKRIERVFRDLGVAFDPSEVNFGYDEDGNMIYIDNSFNPWYAPPRGVTKPTFEAWFNEEKLLVAIRSLVGREQERALKYLERLKKLTQEEREAIEKNSTQKK